jgi:hypothetical protein
MNKLGRHNHNSIEAQQWSEEISEMLVRTMYSIRSLDHQAIINAFVPEAKYIVLNDIVLNQIANLSEIYPVAKNLKSVFPKLANLQKLNAIFDILEYERKNLSNIIKAQYKFSDITKENIDKLISKTPDVAYFLGMNMN